MADLRAVWRGIQAGQVNEQHYAIILEFDHGWQKVPTTDQNNTISTTEPTLPTEPDGGHDSSNAEMESFHLVSNRQTEKLIEAQESALEKATAMPAETNESEEATQP